MQELLNIRFTYLCRATYQNEDGLCPVVLRIIFRRERRDIFTGLYCESRQWDNQNKKVNKDSSNAKTLNQNMDLILRKAAHAFDELKFSGNVFTIDELTDKIKGKESRPTLLIDFLEEGNKKVLKRVGTEILRVTYLKYERSLRYMQDFLQAEFRVKNFSLQKVNLEVWRGIFNIC